MPSKTGSSTEGDTSAADGATEHQHDQAQSSQRSQSPKAKAKRRTKTGCLTCRRRRIKCDETKPACRNCTKSKRECVGYAPAANQRHLAGRPHTPASASSFSWDQGILMPQSGGTLETSNVQEDSLGPEFWQDASFGGLQTDRDHFNGLLPNYVSSTQDLQGDDQHSASQLAENPLFMPGFGVRQDSTTHLRSHPPSMKAHQRSSYAKGSPPGVDDALRDASSESGVVFYRQPFTMSPLADPSNSYIFHYYMTFTAPLMSVFEPWPKPGELSTPPWTTDIPAMAIHHPALAHAILGITALHMSKLDLLAKDISIKHGLYATRRVQKALMQEETRLQVPTLATILMLAFLEVIDGDHAKWMLHLAGAAGLVMEFDYAASFRAIRLIRSQALADAVWSSSPSSSWQQNHFMQHPLGLRSSTTTSVYADPTWDVDERVVSQVLGIDVNYETQRQPHVRSITTGTTISELQIQEFKLLQTLYWYYCKQDVFQGLLSGDLPLLPLASLKLCPPRGRLGDADNVHASMDYLWLILARIVKFGAQDRPRKLIAVEAQGGDWKPMPGFLDLYDPARETSKGATTLNAHGVTKSTYQTDGTDNVDGTESRPTANEGRARKSKITPSSSAGPNNAAPMYGMMPSSSASNSMPPSFQAMASELRKNSPSVPQTVDPVSAENFETATERALEEYHAISAALDMIEQSLGIAFRRVPNVAPHPTPFGPSIEYGTAQIAAIWTFYHAARIVLRRLHPYSPPAALVSAVVNANFTSEHAFAIARIWGGFCAQHSASLERGVIDPVIVSVLTETTFPLFIAGVQFVSSEQRRWTISTLKQVAQTAGWESSFAIGAACETSWERAGLAKKSPPYTRTLEHQRKDPRVRRDRTYDIYKTRVPKLDAATEHHARFVSHDRGLIDRFGDSRVYWAVGMMAVEDDLKKMSLG